MCSLLEDLMYQGDQGADFHPRTHLCILTEKVKVSGSMHVTVTDLVHTCLSNYFMPHRDAASVSWVTRDRIKEHLEKVVSLNENQYGCSVDFQDSIMKSNKDVDAADAILFVSKDAQDFMDTHRLSVLSTIALCLMTTKDNVLIQDMPRDINSIV